MSEVFATADAREVLTAVGVGSCLIIALYDPRLRIGALAHAVLPVRNGAAGGGKHDTRYIDEAIDEMLEQLAALGSRGGLEAKIVGGANMFPGLKEDIGSENISRARRKLNATGIPIVGESVGGAIGRSVEFSLNTGSVTVKIKF